MTQLETSFTKPPPMSNVGVAVLIAFFIASFTVIFTFVDGWPSLVSFIPLTFGVALFGYLFGGLGILSQTPRIDSDGEPVPPRK